MGIFSGEKEITVESVIYNMAGAEENRPSYLKSLVLRNVLSGTKNSIADSLNNGYLHGPAMKFRSFYRWAGKPGNYDQVGMAGGNLVTSGAVNPLAVQAAIPRGAGEAIWVQQADLKDADYSFWVEQWFLANRPDELETAWSADIDEATKQITIVFADHTQVSFAAPDFDYKSKYIYAYNIRIIEGATGPVVPGDLIELGSDDFPDTSSWFFVSVTETPVAVSLTSVSTTTTTKSYSDGRPDQVTTGSPVTTTTNTSYDRTEQVYRKKVILTSSTSRIDTIHLFQDAEIVVATTSTESSSTTVEGGVTVTTTVEIVTDEQRIAADRSYRIDSQSVIDDEHGPLTLFIYRLGSGNADLDALSNQTHDYGQFFPFIPARLDNNFLSESFQPAAYAQAKKAYKKITGSSFDDFIDKVADNPDIDDIDFTYITFGVSLNVIEKSCKKYLYRFFEKLQASQIGGPNIYAQWKLDWDSQAEIRQAWLNWKADPSSLEPEPERPNFVSLPQNVIQITNTGSIYTNYDIRLTWTYITDGQGIGLGKPGAKVGECWIENAGIDEFAATVIDLPGSGLAGRSFTQEKIRIYWQRTANSHTYLDVVGLVHANYIYRGKAIVVTAHHALADPDESGFIVPLHYETYREMSLVDSSQMATACVFGVFNCYKVNKKKWYTSSLFAVIVIIVIAIVTAVFTGGTSLGLLGTALSVGTSLGLTGMAAAIVGSIANALAALVLVTIIEKVAVGIFGEEIGAIIAVVAMLVIGNVSSGFHTTGTFAFNWSDLLKVDNLLTITSSVGNAFAASIRADTAAIGQDMQDYAKQASAEAEKIQQAYFKEFGYGAGQIDPLMFVDSATKILAESSDTFLTRTLMTGSEIAEMSRELLYNFSEYTLKLPDAYS